MWKTLTPNTSKEHTQLAAAVPQVLGVVVGGVYTHAVRVYPGEEGLVVVDEVLGTGVRQLQG